MSSRRLSSSFVSSFSLLLKSNRIWNGSRLVENSFRVGGHGRRAASTSQSVLKNDVNRGAEQTVLKGIRIIDISRVLAGPYCTMLLGDLGAEVIKVEKPGVGDDTRTWGPPWVGKESAYFLAVNRNKRSICVNMKSPEGIQIMKELAASCDVLIENYLPGKLDELGLGYEELSRINPRLIYVTITGFGDSGPYVKRGGYDNIASATGGLLNITGPEDGEPCRVGVAVVDLHTGLYAKGAILAALIHRQHTNKGQLVQCNLLNTCVALLTHIASAYLNCGVESSRMGMSHPNLVPYQGFPTQDDCFVLIGVGNNNQFEELCQRIELLELVKDDRFVNNAVRVTNRKLLVETLTKRFRDKTLAEWLEIFEGVSFPYGPINTIKQAFADPQVIHNKMIQEIEHAEGKIRVAGPAVRYSESGTVLQYPPPPLGQHTAEILREILKYDDDKINYLKNTKVIQ